MLGRAGIVRAARHYSLWSGVAEVPADPILGLVAAFKKDTDPRKVNLAQGAYRTDEGLPLVLNSVRKAEAAIVSDWSLDKEYLGIEGNPEFLKVTAEFALGSDSKAVQEGRVATVQSLSGTGALRLAADTLVEVVGTKEIYISAPSWGNHEKIFASAGLEVKHYAYLDMNSRTSLDIDAFLRDLRDVVPRGAVVLLHACAHNPTGVDPTRDQWGAVAKIFKEKSLVPLFDSAYQGYASGDPDADAYAVRLFDSLDLHPLVCQSYAKNMGLYGERVGAFNAVCPSPAIAAAVLSQIKQTVVRPRYSSPPLHGARIAAAVLQDQSLNKEWRGELKNMSARIARMRAELVDELRTIEAPSPDGGDWGHITDQIGMFAFTGLSEHHVAALLEQHRVYLTRDGRMSLAGLKPADIPYVARALKDVLV